jgi:hypothetical protein
MSHHEQFLLSVKDPIDPVRVQMWHYLFDPHSLPEVPMAPLEPLPTPIAKVETVRDFLDRSNIMRDHKSLLSQALNETA